MEELEKCNRNNSWIVLSGCAARFMLPMVACLMASQNMTPYNMVLELHMELKKIANYWK